MKGFVFIGRGGQGVKSGATVLAQSASNQGLKIQAFPEYGPERMGAPVKSYVKLSKISIRSFSQISAPDYVLLIDKSLIKEALPLLVKKTVLIINDVCEPVKYVNKFKIKNKVVTIDATKISLEELKMNKPNVPILGALCRIEKMINLNMLSNNIEDFFKKKKKLEVGKANARAIKRAYDEVLL